MSAEVLPHNGSTEVPSLGCYDPAVDTADHAPDELLEDRVVAEPEERGLREVR